MLIVPLIFSTIVVGIGKTGDVKAVGRMGVKAHRLLRGRDDRRARARPGASRTSCGPATGLTLPPSGEALAKPKTLVETLLHLFPSNVVDAMAKQDILQVVIFATLVGDRRGARPARAEPFLRIMDSIVAVMFQLTDYVMSLTPLGVFGAMAGSVSHHGLSVLGSYAKLVASLYGALVLFALLVLVPGAADRARANSRLFFRKIREPFLLAFSTASSEAALPRALEKMVEFGVPESVAGFVIPAGYSFNLDGSTLYISLASLTIAQAAHVDLSLSTELLMMLTFLMTSKGVAGVPRASLVIIAAGCAVVRPARRGRRRDDPRGGRADGHGAHVHQRHGQLRRVGRRRAVGGRARRAARGPGREFTGRGAREEGDSLGSSGGEP